MADQYQSQSARPATLIQSTSFTPVPSEAEPHSIRTRTRRIAKTQDANQGPAPRGSPFSGRDSSPSPSRATPSIFPQAWSSNQPSGPVSRFMGGAVLESSALSQSWTTVQDFASALLSPRNERPVANRSQSSPRAGGTPAKLGRATGHENSTAWGPEPPGKSLPSIQDIAAGARAERDAALKAARTAKVLESHEGVNGGLDVSGRYKRRTSDAGPAPGFLVSQGEADDLLVYVHYVGPGDTYAGITLKYRCHGDELRRANGLWSRDNVQVRKWLVVPVDTCDVRGKPCDPPRGPRPSAPAATQKATHNGTSENDLSGEALRDSDDHKPWTHVRWVSIGPFGEPVEMVRMSRRTLGYFPPRRKKSIQTASSPSTPKRSIDVAATPEQSREDARVQAGNGGSTPERLFGAFASASVDNEPDGNERGAGTRPSWMRRPGGVGSLGRTSRAPGPERDYFNSWARKHMPGLNLDSLPSMSILGSETARFGVEAGGSGIVDGPLDEQQAGPFTGGRQGSSLDRAASVVETWIRGAFSTHPSTPGGPGHGGDQQPVLIELEDTGSEDRSTFTGGSAHSNLMTSLSSSHIALFGEGASTGAGVGRRDRSKAKKSD